MVKRLTTIALVVTMTVAITLTTDGDNNMEPTNERQHLLDLADAYGTSRTKRNKAIAKAHLDAANRIETTTPVEPPPVVLPPPTSNLFPITLENNPTGPKKALPPRQGTVTLTTPGQTIDGVNADQIIVNATNVTIRNFKTRQVVASRTGYNASGLVLEDGIIDGENQMENGVSFSGYTCRRTEITRVIDSFKAHGNTTIEDCWIHDLNFQTGSGTGAGNYSHNDGVQVSSGTNIIVRGSRFENMRGNGGVFIDPDQGPIAFVIVDNNYFNLVGNYPIYIKESASNPSTGLPDQVTVTNNTIGDRRPENPDWGPMFCEIRATNLTFTNNKTADGQTIKLDGYGKGYL